MNTKILLVMMIAFSASTFASELTDTNCTYSIGKLENFSTPQVKMLKRRLATRGYEIAENMDEATFELNAEIGKPTPGNDDIAEVIVDLRYLHNPPRNFNGSEHTKHADVVELRSVFNILLGGLDWIKPFPYPRLIKKASKELPLCEVSEANL